MIKLLIKSVEPYAYILSSEDKEYRLHLEFLGLEKKPTVGDYLYLPENIINEPNNYTFGLIGGIYAKKKDIKDDIIKVVGNDYEYYLQRYYG